jgi:hypothetical protein
MRESKYRRQLAVKLDADIVTSLDKGGCRRFRSRRTGKWGYCDNYGDVIRSSRFDKASHFNEIVGVYEVWVGSTQQFFDRNWVEHKVDDLIGTAF